MKSSYPASGAHAVYICILSMTMNMKEAVDSCLVCEYKCCDCILQAYIGKISVY